MHKTTQKSALLWLGVIVAMVCMYVAYEKLGTNANLFSLVTGILGAIAGFLASQASNVKSQAQLERILGASLIREKEAEVKTVEEAKALYQQELQNLKTIIEREGNQLLLKRLRALYLTDLREKLREVESIESELALGQSQPVSSEVAQVRSRLEGLLSNVRNPEEDDRLIREFCYSIPIMGNLSYFMYSVWKKVDPSVQDRVHNRLNSFARAGSGSKFLAQLLASSAIAVFIVGIGALVVALFDRLNP